MLCKTNTTSKRSIVWEYNISEGPVRYIWNKKMKLNDVPC